MSLSDSAITVDLTCQEFEANLRAQGYDEVMQRESSRALIGHGRRLPSTTFAWMLDNPRRHALPRFAGQRVRMADVAVEMINRQPIRVLRASFSILTFDGQGFLDRTAFERHQYSRAELALAPALGPPSRGKSLVEDRVKFIEHGGRWKPSNAMLRLIEKAALSRTPCPRLWP